MTESPATWRRCKVSQKVWLISENAPAELIAMNAFFSIVRYPLGTDESEVMTIDNDNLLFYDIQPEELDD